MALKKNFARLTAELRDRFSGSSSLALGCSGGLDSMVLAEGLVEAGIPFRVLHFNHGWRGKASDGDRDFVRIWCREHGVPFNTRKWSRPRKSEAAARTARLSFFRSLSKQHALGGVLLAHHQDDLAETLVFNLLRGTGPGGLASLKACNHLNGLTLYRPLLGYSRKELESMARKRNLAWREDASNRDLKFTRNRIRHELLPAMQLVSGREPAPLLARTARILMEENDYWERAFTDVPATLSVRELRELHPAAQRRKILYWLLQETEAAPGFEEIESIRRLALEKTPAKVNLKRGQYCRRRKGVLFIES